MDPRSNTSIQEDDTLTPSIRSQTESLSSSTGGLQGSESGLGPAGKLRRRSDSRSPLMSPQWEGLASSMDPLSLDSDSLDCRPYELDTKAFVSGTSGFPGLDFCLSLQSSFVLQMWEEKKTASSFWSPLKQTCT